MSGAVRGAALVGWLIGCSGGGGEGREGERGRGMGCVWKCGCGVWSDVEWWDGELARSVNGVAREDAW